jgi:hypothetical protein
MDIFVKGERIYAIRPRRFRFPNELVREIQKDPLHYGVSKGLVNEIAKAKVFYGEDSVFSDSLPVYTKHLNRKFFFGL